MPAHPLSSRAIGNVRIVVLMDQSSKMRRRASGVSRLMSRPLRCGCSV